MATATPPSSPQTLSVVWDQKPNPEALKLVRLPADKWNPVPRVKAVFGDTPFPYRHNHYTDANFYRHDREKGTLHNVYGQRLIRVSEDFLVAMLSGLEEEVGDAAGEIMYKCGYEWGVEDMKSFSPKVQAEFNKAMSKMSTGTLMETWWWPLQIEGWGGWHYDFRQGKQGLIFIDVYESAMAQSLGDIGKVVCYFYAGLFAAFFTALANRSLACIEIQCYSMGEDYCKFLISTSKRVNAAAFWRNEGATSKDIMKKLKEA